MQRWQRSLLAVGTAGVLLFALSLHLSTVQPPDAAVDHAPRAGLEALRPIEDGASAASRRFMWPAKRHQPRSRLDAANQEEEPGDAGVILRCKHIPHVQSTMLLSTKIVTMGLYLLNMETTADEPGVFYADFIMFLRQHGQPMTSPDSMGHRWALRTRSRLSPCSRLGTREDFAVSRAHSSSLPISIIHLIASASRSRWSRSNTQ